MDLFEIALEHDSYIRESPYIEAIQFNQFDLEYNETITYFYKQLKRVSSIPLNKIKNEIKNERN